MELYNTPPSLPPPPASSHSRRLYSPPPSRTPHSSLDISSIDEVLSVLVNQHQTHPLSLPPTHLPPDVNQHKSHSLSLPPTSPPPPQLPPDISPSDEFFRVLANRHLPHALSLPINPPLPIPSDYLSDGDIKKRLISELSSPANSLIDKFGKISIINSDHFSNFTGSVTVSKGVLADSLNDKFGKISINDGDHFLKFTGSVTVSKGNVDSGEPIHAGEDDSDEADDERNDSGDGDDEGSDSGDGDDNQSEGVEDDQVGGNADPNKGNRSDVSSPTTLELEGVPKQYIRFYGIYRRNYPLLLGKIQNYKVEKLNTFQEFEKYVRKCVAKLEVEDLPEHYEVVFEREITQQEQEYTFATLSLESMLKVHLSRVVLETPQIRYDIYLKDLGVFFRLIGSISKAECAAIGSIIELAQHLQQIVYKMKLDEYVVDACYVCFESAITDEQKEYPFAEIPKDLTSLLRILSRIVIEVESKTPHSQPNEASGSGTKRQNEATGSGTKKTSTDVYQF